MFRWVRVPFFLHSLISESFLLKLIIYETVDSELGKIRDSERAEQIKNGSWVNIWWSYIEFLQPLSSKGKLLSRIIIIQRQNMERTNWLINNSQLHRSGRPEVHLPDLWGLCRPEYWGDGRGSLRLLCLLSKAATRRILDGLVFCLFGDICRRRGRGLCRLPLHAQQTTQEPASAKSKRN